MTSSIHSSTMNADDRVADYQSGTLSWRVGLNFSDRAAVVIYAQPKLLAGSPLHIQNVPAWRGHGGAKARTVVEVGAI